MPRMSSRKPSPARRAGRLAMAVAITCCVVAGGARAQEAGTPGIAAQAAPPTWWSAFHDPTLDLLLANGLLEPDADRARLLALQARAASLYLKVRVYAVRLHTTRLMHDAAGRQWALLQEAGQSDSDLARVTASLLRETAERERRFVVLRSESVAALAEALGGRLPAKTVAQLLEPVLQERRLPVPEFEVPEAISGLVLRQRPDVMAAEAGLVLAARGSTTEQLRLAQYLQAISQEIGPEDAALAATPGDDVPAVLLRARGEIGRRLADVTARGEVAGTQAAYVQQLTSRYEAVLKAFSEGRVAEVEALAGLLQLLQEQDRLAASIGLAGLAWVAFQESIGGAGQARTSDLLGAVPAQD